MEKSDFVAMPARQVKAQQNFSVETTTPDDTGIRMFSMEDVADRVFHRKKKAQSCFGMDDDETTEDGQTRNEYRAQLALLQDNPEEDAEIQQEDMDAWLQKLHMRTQHIIGKVTPLAMTKLAATNHVATAAIRLKGKYRLGMDSSDDEGVKSDQASAAEPTPSETTKESPKRGSRTKEKSAKEGSESSSKDGESVRTKKAANQTNSEGKSQRRKKSSSSKASDESSKSGKIQSSSSAAASSSSADGQRKPNTRPKPITRASQTK